MTTKITPEQWATMSPAQKFANTTESKQEKILAGIDPAELEHVWDEWWARPNQVIPEDPYYPIHLLLTGRGWGKALPLDTPIATPNGWTTIGQLTPGDQVYDEKGQPTTVTSVHAPYTPDSGDMYRIHFDGDNYQDACGQHQWTVVDYNYIIGIRKRHYYGDLKLSDVDWASTELGQNRPKTVTTEDLFNDPYYYAQGYAGERRHNHYVGRAQALQGAYVSTSMPEYEVGALIPTMDESELPYNMLRSLPSQRWEMVQGLTDVHGRIHNIGSRRGQKIRYKKFTDAQKKFVLELITSLGFEARREYKNPKYTHEFVEWVPHSINPFRHNRMKYALQLKSDIPFRSMFHTVRKVEKIPSVEVRCITVDSPSSLYLAGEAMIPTHNTRTMAEWVRRQAINYPGCRIGILGRTAADVRDIMALGESGILNVGPEEEKPEYKPSQRKLEWSNGSIATMFSAETPDQLRGQQFNFFVCDELASYTQFIGADGLTAFQNIRIATRLGERPYGVVATTPKRTDVIRELLEEAKSGKVRVVRGATRENAALSSAYKDTILGQFAGTALEKQELEGEMLDDFPEGALWTEDIINPARIVSQNPPAATGGTIIAVDPSVSDSPKDECGIVVIGFTNHRLPHQRHAFVLEDGSLLAKPEVWAKKVSELYNRWGASAVIVETNQGRALLNNLMHTINPAMRIIGVNASQGKKLRAEPVVLPYQQGRVHHYGSLPTLESQMTTWEPEHTKKSPDRIDALVHGITAVLIKPPPELPMARAKTSDPSARRLNLNRGTGKFSKSPRQMSMRRSR